MKDSLKALRFELNKQLRAAEERNAESAHVAEDNARAIALRLIRDGCDKPSEVAALALTSDQVEHERYFS